MSTSRLGSYEVVGRLGAGGMGEVFRAHDAKLNRDVALKLLPKEIAGDPERLARFRREAQVLASLNHPRVGAIHGLEEANGSPFLVLELVEGEDLSTRMARGPIPLDEALAIALQIAEGLEAAHEKGIVHRDLKPANVKVTPDGFVKLLDFGLAKASSTETAQDLSHSPTMTAAYGTQAGVILGTAGYMSPEQARGRPVDKRADIWAFGVVLHEMLSGQRLFSGETVSDVLAAVLKNEPDLGALGDVPPRVRHVLARCLQKDPRQRLHDIGDARLELLELDEAPARAIEAAGHARGRWLPWMVTFAAVAGSVIFALAIGRRPAGRAMPLRLEVLPPAGTVSSGPIELSRDGTKLAFTSTGATGKTLLFWRSLDALEARPLSGTEGADSPFWSPDGASLGFFAGKKLMRIALAGGPPRELADAPDHRGGSWGGGAAQGVIIYAPDGGGPIFRIPADGGTPVAVTKLDPALHETSHRWPHFLADGNRFLFLLRKPKPPQRLAVEAASLDGGKRLVITESSTSGLVNAGRLLFVRESSLLSQPIDERSLALSGEPRVLANDVWSSPTELDGLTAFSIAANGTLAYRRGGNPRFLLVFRDRDGKRLGTVGETGFIANPRLSGDLHRVLFEVSDLVRSTTAIMSTDVETGRQTRLSFGTGDDIRPLLSPDGRTIVFSSDARGPYNLYRMDASGGAATLLVESDAWSYAESWSSDGRFLAYQQIDSTTKSDIWVLPLTGDRKPQAVVRTPANEENAAFSPDGRFLAYDSDESGTREVFVQTFPVNGSKWQVSIAGGSAPCWAQGGRELFYISADGRLVAVSIRSSSASELSFGAPQPLFSSPTATTRLGRQYDVTPDGKRFLLNEAVGLETASPIVVVIPEAD